MELPEEKVKEYEGMMSELTEYAKSLSMDLNRLTIESEKYAKAGESPSDSECFYPEEMNILRKIVGFGTPIMSWIQELIGNGTYTLELTDLKVDPRTGNVYDGRTKRVSQIISECKAHLIRPNVLYDL